MSIYIEPNELVSTYNEAARVAEDWFKPFDEYERIAGNKISKTLSKGMPRVNDGSLASSLLETPMNVLPFMQPGKFKSTTKKKAWINELANIIWKTKIVPNANTQAPFFNKEQMALYRTLKYGAQPRYNFYTSSEKYTGSDWSLPYIKNVKLEPGKFSIDDCDYVFLDIYYTKLQLKRIIEQAKADIKEAKANGEKPNTSWNIESLKKLADMSMTQKEMEEQNINERDKQINSSGIKTTVCFNRGKDAPFYMFSKHLPEGELLREWKNPDPTGDIPITMQYCYETLESPYAIGRVELAGPTQNVLDYMTQAHVLATQIGLQPPVKITGSTATTDMGSLVYKPRAQWELGNAQADIVQTSSSVYTQFPANFGLYKSQLQTLQGRTDGSVSATSGNPSFSKTSAGVNMQEERTNAQDNYLRNQADSASAKMAEKMMNIHMAMMKGADILEIAEEDRDRLIQSGYFDDNPMTKDIPSITEIPFMYEDIKDTFTFEYDPRPETDQDEKAKWLELLDIYASDPNMDSKLIASGYEFNVGEAFKKVVSASGIDGLDKVLVKLSEEEVQQRMLATQGVQPEISGATEGLPPEMVQGAEPAQPDISLEETMAMYGVDENVAMAVMEARRQGYAEEEILKNLGGNQ